MNHDEYKAYLMEQYMDQICSIKTVDNVITVFGKKLDIIEINESDLSPLEEPHFRFLRLNYSNNINTDIDEVNFVFFMVKKNDRSSRYYELMEHETERVIIVTESKANLITSNCKLLSLDMQIERGLKESYIKQDTPELIAYLTLFDFRTQI